MVILLGSLIVLTVACGVVAHVLINRRAKAKGWDKAGEGE